MQENTKEPPEELTRFSHNLPMTGDLVTWKIKELNCGVEIRHKHPINFTAIRHAFYFLVGTLIFFFLVRHYKDKIPNNGGELALFLAGLLVLVCPVACFLLEIVIVSFDSIKWKKKRLCYDSATGKLEFPCDDVVYRPNAYKRLVLGYTSAWIFSESALLNISFHKAVQFYLLVLDKNNEWKRHDLGSAKNRRHAEKTLRKLQPFLRCDITSRCMSYTESYTHRQTGAKKET